MKIQIMSDIHLEFHADLGKNFIESLDPTDVDVLVLAGDITTGFKIPAALEQFCAKYKEVVYVTGNHEYYGYSPEIIHNIINRLDFKNFHWLNRSEVTIEGQRFMGATLWFKDTPHAPKHQLNDFRQIKGFEPWVYEENRKAIDFFDKIQPGNVVVSHHLPSNASVAEQYLDDPLNCFFVCDITQTIKSKKPKLFCHGHTHDSCYYDLGGTRVVCNPLGYAGYATNPNFSDHLIETV